MRTFWKYHGAGNDFVVLDVRTDSIDDPASLAIRVCHRRLGVGADGILLLGPTDQDGCDVSMRIYNSDGSRAEMCGNGLRCIVKHVLDAEPGRDTLTVGTGAGPLACQAHRDADGAVNTVRVAMGKPILERAAIPVAGDGRPVRETIDHPDGASFEFTGVSMGNPHAVIFLGEGDPLVHARRFGPGLEGHRRFPNNANISFVRADGTSLRAAVYERGAGLTAACGTGACAIGVAAGLEDRVPFGTPMTVSLPGGDLTICVDPDLQNVWMTGPARRVFESQLDESQLATVEACQSLTKAIS
ncbi:MAG: diaminopimelate epimerase [bacterium]